MKVTFTDGSDREMTERQAVAYLRRNGVIGVKGFEGPDAERAAYLAGCIVEGKDLEQERLALGNKTVRQREAELPGYGEIVEERRLRGSKTIRRWRNGKRVARNG